MGKIVLPCANPKVTSLFDEIRTLDNGEKIIHGGYDVVTNDPNRFIFSICDGKIVTAGWSNTFGNRIWIKPLDSELEKKYPFIVYAHLEKIKRFSGAILAGDIIGIMGNTGMSRGVHLHIEARSTIDVNGKRIRITELEELLKIKKS